MNYNESGKVRLRTLNRLKKYHPERKAIKIGSRTSKAYDWQCIVLCTEKYTCELVYTKDRFAKLSQDDLSNEIYAALLPQYDDA